MFARGFLGVVPTTLIETIVDICKPQDWPAVYVACSGTFRTERGLLSKFPKLEVQSNDVSLLSTALGLAGAGKRLDFKFKGELAWIEDLGLAATQDRVAAVLLALTYSSYAKGRANRFKSEHMEHLRANFADYIQRTRKVIDKTLSAMPIAGYFAGDFRDHIETAIGRKAGVIAYPPTFKGGYEKLFDYVHANVEWQEPSYRLFDPEADVRPVLDRLQASGVPFFLYLDQEVEGFSPQVRMKARGKRDIFGYGRANASSWRAPRSNARPFAYDAIRLDALTAKSQVQIVPAPEAYICFLKVGATRGAGGGIAMHGKPTRSPEAQVYHQWYRTAGWRALRSAQLKREPLCRMCAKAGRRTKATTADHIEPHRGDRALFFNLSNLQSLCEIHHGDKQRIENGGRPRTPVGIDGWPLS